jgi:hypothetical protein
VHHHGPRQNRQQYPDCFFRFHLSNLPNTLHLPDAEGRQPGIHTLRTQKNTGAVFSPQTNTTGDKDQKIPAQTIHDERLK